MQWGRVDYDYSPPEGDVTVNFPIAYSNACLNAQASRIVVSDSNDHDNDGGALICRYSKTNLTVNLAAFSDKLSYALRGFTWFTIGW